LNPIVRHKKTSVPYEYLGENRFVNLVTLKEGIVDDEKAREVFAINVEASQLFHEYPILKQLISSLKMKLDVVVSSEKQKDGGTINK